MFVRLVLVEDDTNILVLLLSKDLAGKLIGGCCALSGVFILTLPIPIGGLCAPHTK